MLKRGQKARISHQSAKGKGRNLQKSVAQQIGQLLGMEHKVGYDEDCLIRPARMGVGGVDIKIDPLIRPQFPFAVECKNSEKWALPGTIKQVRKYVGKGYKHWIVFLRKKEFKKTMAVIEADLLFHLLKKAQDGDRQRAANKRSYIRNKKQ